MICHMENRFYRNLPDSKFIRSFNASDCLNGASSDCCDYSKKLPIRYVLLDFIVGTHFKIFNNSVSL